MMFMEIACTADGQRIEVDRSVAVVTSPTPPNVESLPTPIVLMTFGATTYPLNLSDAAQLLVDLASVVTEDDETTARIAQEVAGCAV